MRDSASPRCPVARTIRGRVRPLAHRGQPRTDRSPSGPSFRDGGHLAAGLPRAGRRRPQRFRMAPAGRPQGTWRAARASHPRKRLPDRAQRPPGAAGRGPARAQPGLPADLGFGRGRAADDSPPGGRRTRRDSPPHAARGAARGAGGGHRDQGMDLDRRCHCLRRHRGDPCPGHSACRAADGCRRVGSARGRAAGVRPARLWPRKPLDRARFRRGALRLRARQLARRGTRPRARAGADVRARGAAAVCAGSGRPGLVRTPAEIRWRDGRAPLPSRTGPGLPGGSVRTGRRRRLHRQPPLPLPRAAVARAAGSGRAGPGALACRHGCRGRIRAPCVGLPTPVCELRRRQRRPGCGGESGGRPRPPHHGLPRRRSYG